VSTGCSSRRLAREGFAHLAGFAHVVMADPSLAAMMAPLPVTPLQRRIRSSILLLLGVLAALLSGLVYGACVLQSIQSHDGAPLSP
jgi:hypothetical protein